VRQEFRCALLGLAVCASPPTAHGLRRGQESCATLRFKCPVLPYCTFNENVWLCETLPDTADTVTV
jgi:hypothetical protein